MQLIVVYDNMHVCICTYIFIYYKVTVSLFHIMYCIIKIYKL